MTQGAFRLDTSSGIREIAEYVGDDGRSARFVFMHLPRGKAKTGVVICSSVHAEFTRNYRREVLIGRSLAASGIAVLRFHYRGQGNSEGENADTTFDSMVEDAVWARARLLATTDMERCVFFGTRFGGLIAASVASADNSPVVLWDPVVAVRDYFRDIFRAARVQAMRGGNDAAFSRDLEEELRAMGSVGVLGHTIGKGLYETSRRCSLDALLGPWKRKMLLLRMGRDPRNDSALDSVIGRWRTAGFEIDEFRLARREPWWFSAGEATALEAAERPRQVTVDWIRGCSEDHGHDIDISGLPL
jgi:alpha/beta superfamily hydrolase